MIAYYKRKRHTGIIVDELQEQLKLALLQERKKLEELGAFYHYQEILARELMCRAQSKLVELDQEKNWLMQNTNDLDCRRKPNGFYQRPFLFSDDH